MLINEENCMQALFEYCEPLYSEKAFSVRHECPYDFEDMDAELAFKQIFTWFMTERVNPETAKTPLEEFVELNRDRFVEGLAELMLGMKKVVRGDFVVVESRNEFLIVTHKQSMERYRLYLQPQNRRHYAAGQKISGRICPWKDCYRFAGIFTMEPTQDDIIHSLGMPTLQEMTDYVEGNLLGKAESVILRSNMGLLNALNKLPSNWIDSMVREFGLPKGGKKGEKTVRIASFIINGLETILKDAPPESRDVLKKIISGGGFMRYGKLAKFYSDDTRYWWDRKLPSSPVGYLRAHGLLYVGRMYVKEKAFRVVFVPADLRDALEHILDSGLRLE